ncbi:MAG: PIN domain-containing protein [Euryarchaeota archaeon]|nr:PIN domain-containing protein [Euryarchaeota archaeon]
MGYVLDSSFLIDLTHKDPGAVEKVRTIESAGVERYLCTPVLYEVLTGLYFRRSKSELSHMRRIVARFMLLPFDEMAARMAAEVRAELLRTGRAASAVDIMVAGIAMHHGHVLVTRDKRLLDLDMAERLDVESY